MAEEQVEFAPLAVIDLSHFDDPSRRHEVVAQVDKACRDIGFFAIVNFPGISPEDVQRTFAIERQLFELPLAEKKKFDMEARGKGNYFGYKAIGQQVVDDKGSPDGNEFFNTPKNDTWLMPQPEPILAARDFIDRFLKQCHGVCSKLLEVYAEVLEVPEEMGGKDFFKRTHRFEGKSGDQMRMVRVDGGRGEDSEQQLKMASHTDFGTTTLVFSQPVLGLQILLNDGTWKYVRPHEGAIIVNIGDAMQFLSNGYLRSNFHRVVRPPSFQSHLTRYSLVYFLRPENDVLLQPIKTRKTALMGAINTSAPITAGEWIKTKVVGSLTSNKNNVSELASIHERIMTTRGPVSEAGIQKGSNLSKQPQDPPHGETEYEHSTVSGKVVARYLNSLLPPPELLATFSHAVDCPKCNLQLSWIIAYLACSDDDLPGNVKTKLSRIQRRQFHAILAASPLRTKLLDRVLEIGSAFAELHETRPLRATFGFGSSPVEDLNRFAVLWHHAKDLRRHVVTTTPIVKALLDIGLLCDGTPTLTHLTTGNEKLTDGITPENSLETQNELLETVLTGINLALGEDSTGAIARTIVNHP
ncbi:hypothetical protein HDU93_002056 [Gonapodya sp. JEL0774]|nr:hypothetical protein HDU93_002056 [Gonapodya sp. JEL0774]